jgi:ABC-type dipeptide/oligopeptide/nickel transport system permease subunit
MVLWPGVWMIIAVFGFIFFGEGLRERLDPRLK